MSALTVRLSAVTPLFIGGAGPDPTIITQPAASSGKRPKLPTPAELRPPTFKGLLRYWYRALDGGYDQPAWPEGPNREDWLFGSTDTGQGPCLLRVESWQTGTAEWNEDRYKRQYEGPYNPAQPEEGGFQRGTGKNAENGILYLGYTLRFGENDRRAMPADSTFTLTIVPRPKDGDVEEVRRAWAASLWLLVHVGGVGSRSRRGLGSLRIQEWGDWDECKLLALPSQATTPQEWKAGMEQALAVLGSWFPQRVDDAHTALGPRARLRLVTIGFDTWEEALDDAGLRLQRFRRYRKPDYDEVRDHIAKRDERRLQEKGVILPATRAFLIAGPERSGFGLPLTFRYSSLGYREGGKSRAPELNLVGAEHGRRASPLFIRVLRLGNRYHSALVYLPAPLLPDNEQLRDARDREARHRWPIPSAAKHIVGQFLDAQRDALEVRLPL